MPLTYFTDVDAVRSEGSLKDPSESAGAASPSQVKSAIRNAKQRMIDVLTRSLYYAVLNYSSADLADTTTLVNAAGNIKSEQYAAFQHAEACYAIALLSIKLSAQQLSDTGIIQSVEIGKARQSFASSEESAKVGQRWEMQANRWLAPYLTVPQDTITKLPTAFASKKGSFYIGSL